MSATVIVQLADTIAIYRNATMWGIYANWRSLIALLVAAVVIAPGPAGAASRDRGLEKRLLRHIEILASDEYQGREPGTDGEARTLRYLGEQWFDIGLVSGTNDPGNPWFSPVTLVARQPSESTAQFVRRGRPVYLDKEDVLVLTSGKRSFVRNAPILFVGKAEELPLGRNDLAGRIALLLDGGIRGGERQNALIAAGASAVLTVLDGDRTIENVTARRQRSGYALAEDNPGGDLEAFITREAMQKLLQTTGLTVERLEERADRPGFVSLALPLAATLEATTQETRITSHNMIGKLPGKRPGSGAVLMLAHWDHFGICAQAPAEDLVCNGAIDNASGVATLTEVARRLEKGRRPDRDIYFLATTAEEIGLLGAHAFAEDPPLPLSSIVAAFNIDSNAIASQGKRFAIVGRGMTGLDAQIEAAAEKSKVRIVEGEEANAYVQRQDGWALLQHDIPAVMVTTAYADIRRMERYFESDYHRPSDDLSRNVVLEGAAADVGFLTDLARWFADPAKVPAAAP
jgi:hypothetical protein